MPVDRRGRRVQEMARESQPAMHPAVHVPADDYLDAREPDFAIYEGVGDIKCIKGEVYIKGYLREVHAALVRANPHKYEIVNAEFRHLNLGEQPSRFSGLEGRPR